MSTQFENDRTQTDILVNATVQATLISIQRAIDDGATLEEVREIVAGLLRYAESKMPQDDAHIKH